MLALMLAPCSRVAFTYPTHQVPLVRQLDLPIFPVMRGLALALCALVGSLALAGGAEARLVARGSVKQVQVTGVKAHARVVLLGRAGRKVQSRKADALGGLVFRGVKPGRGYRVKSGSSRSARFTVMSTRSAPPSKKIYRQKIPAKGYGYVTT